MSKRLDEPLHAAISLKKKVVVNIVFKHLHNLDWRKRISSKFGVARYA